MSWDLWVWKRSYPKEGSESSCVAFSPSLLSFSPLIYSLFYFIPNIFLFFPPCPNLPSIRPFSLSAFGTDFGLEQQFSLKLKLT